MRHRTRLLLGAGLIVGLADLGIVWEALRGGAPGHYTVENGRMLFVRDPWTGGDSLALLVVGLLNAALVVAAVKAWRMGRKSASLEKPDRS
jgi:Ethanolamine utilization protein EutJ (predicted chaperonin)